MSGKSLWNREEVHVTGEKGSKHTVEFIYSGDEKLEKVFGCGCVSRKIEGNKLKATFKIKRKEKSITLSVKKSDGVFDVLRIHYEAKEKRR